MQKKNPINSLKEKQKRLNLNVINYDLDKMWKSHPLVNSLRERVVKALPKDGFYDPQDLEHQSLFRLTTFDPKDINDEIIDFVVQEQYAVMQERLSKLDFDLEYLFRGLSGKYHDLNVKDRLDLCWQDDKLIAKNENRSFNVEFRTVHDERIISLFSNELHYIHRDRPKGETFGFYFVGDEIPWAIETTEPSVIAKQYKRDALLANGIDPNKAIELTRFYTLPGAPINAISMMDGLVAKYYKDRGMEALFTTTMPMYSKTKSTTIAGGLNKPLLVKDLRHKFIPTRIDGHTYYRHVTTVPEDHDEIEVIKTHPNFPTMLVVEVFRILSEKSIEPLPILGDYKKVIYIMQRDHCSTEEEIKLPVENISDTLNNIRLVSAYSRTEYIRDVVYGDKLSKEAKKIRLRISDNLEYSLVEATRKYRITEGSEVKREIEETIYKGSSEDEAKSMIELQGDFVEENSYEKMRVYFSANGGVDITLDIYPYGAVVEIEGEEEKVKSIASKMGYTKKDYILDSADDLYLKWIKDKKLPEQWDVRFGLNGKK